MRLFFSLRSSASAFCATPSESSMKGILGLWRTNRSIAGEYQVNTTGSEPSSSCQGKCRRIACRCGFQPIEVHSRGDRGLPGDPVHAGGQPAVHKGGDFLSEHVEHGQAHPAFGFQVIGNRGRRIEGVGKVLVKREATGIRCSGCVVLVVRIPARTASVPMASFVIL